MCNKQFQGGREKVFVKSFHKSKISSYVELYVLLRILRESTFHSGNEELNFIQP